MGKKKFFEAKVHRSHFMVTTDKTATLSVFGKDPVIYCRTCLADTGQEETLRNPCVPTLVILGEVIKN